jgi:hypothetical protein
MSPSHHSHGSELNQKYSVSNLGVAYERVNSIFNVLVQPEGITGSV